jgi:hypothetical protein
MKAFFGDAKYHENKRIEKIQRGGNAKNSQIEGLRLMQPLLANGEAMPIGSIVSTEYGECKMYDGRLRIIDSDTFNKIVKEHKERKKQIEEIVEAFLDCGTDELSMHFLGPYHSFLYKQLTVDEGRNLGAFLMSDGYDFELSQYIIVTLKFDKNANEGGLDARVSSICFTNETSPEYTLKIMKLELIIKYANIILTGRKVTPNPSCASPTGELFNSNNREMKSVGRKAAIEDAGATTVKNIDYAIAKNAAYA